ncbi:hypothetical protein K2X85_16380 [bacterium]|nr:hypothetical protein [bacterium]
MKDIDPQKLAGLFYGAVAKSLPIVWLYCHPEWWEEVAINAQLDIAAITEDAGRAYSN